MALNLLAKLGLDISPFTRGLNAAESAGKRTANVFARDIGPGLKNSILGGLTTGMILGAGKQVLDYAGKINDLSEQYGINKTEIQGLMAATADSGLEFEKLGAALDKVGQARRDAAQGNAKLRDEFSRFGVTLADLNDPAKTNLDLLKQIGGTLSTMTPTAAIRESFGELVGEKGQRLIELVKALQDIKPVSLLSDDEVKTLDSLGDTVGSFFREIKVLGGRAIADMSNMAASEFEREGGGFKGARYGLYAALGSIVTAPFRAAAGADVFGVEGKTDPLTAAEVAAAKADMTAPPLFNETAKTGKTTSAGKLPTFDPRIAAGGLASAGLFFGGAGNPLLREVKQQTDLAKQSVAELKRVRDAIINEL
jgi:hypothetical protein